MGGDRVVRLTLDHGEHKRLALAGRQLTEGVEEFAHHQTVFLRRALRQRIGHGGVDGDRRPQATKTGNKLVTLNAEHPAGEIGAGLEARTSGERLENGLLHQVVGAVAVVGE